MKKAVIKDKLKTVFQTDNLYVLLEWFASGVTFVFLWIVYRFSDAAALGESAWLLNLVSMSLFISAAVQYYAMLNKKGVWASYVAFLPVVTVELAVLSFWLNAVQWILFAAILLTNTFYAAFRGFLMSENQLIKTALLNIGEQGVKLTLLLIFIFTTGWDPKSSLLLGTTIAYILFAGIAFFSVKRHRINTSVKEYWHFKQIANYSVMLLVIYLILSLDVLSLKGFYDIEAKVSLLKPWGQIIYIASIPLINLFLLRRQEGRSTTGKLTQLFVLWSVYLIVSYLSAGTLNNILFQKTLDTGWLLPLVVIEHIIIAFICTLLYKILQENRKTATAVLIMCASLACISAVPYCIPGDWVVSAFVLIYLATLILLFRGERLFYARSGKIGSQS